VSFFGWVFLGFPTFHLARIAAAGGGIGTALFLLAVLAETLENLVSGG